MDGRGACVAGGGACVAGACVAGACMAGEIGVWWGHAWQGACMAEGDVHGRGAVCGRYYEIQSMSGWYESYWNAFLCRIGFSKCIECPLLAILGVLCRGKL